MNGDEEDSFDEARTFIGGTPTSPATTAASYQPQQPPRGVPDYHLPSTNWSTRMNRAIDSSKVSVSKSQCDGFISVKLQSDVPDLQEFLCKLPQHSVGIQRVFDADLSTSTYMLEFTPPKTPHPARQRRDTRVPWYIVMLLIAATIGLCSLWFTT